jgi:hypothetical protein
VITTLIFLPAILALISSAIAWRTVSRPWLFLVASALGLFGVQALVAPAVTAFFLFPPPAGSVADLTFGFGRGLVVGAALQLIVGLPFVWWLGRGLRKS